MSSMELRVTEIVDSIQFDAKFLEGLVYFNFVNEGTNENTGFFPLLLNDKESQQSHEDICGVNVFIVRNSSHVFEFLESVRLKDGMLLNSKIDELRTFLLLRVDDRNCSEDLWRYYWCVVPLDENFEMIFERSLYTESIYRFFCKAVRRYDLDIKSSDLYPISIDDSLAFSSFFPLNIEPRFYPLAASNRYVNLFLAQRNNGSQINLLLKILLFKVKELPNHFGLKIDDMETWLLDYPILRCENPSNHLLFTGSLANETNDLTLNVNSENFQLLFIHDNDRPEIPMRFILHTSQEKVNAFFGNSLINYDHYIDGIGSKDRCDVIPYKRDGVKGSKRVLSLVANSYLCMLIELYKKKELGECFNHFFATKNYRLQIFAELSAYIFERFIYIASMLGDDVDATYAILFTCILLSDSSYSSGKNVLSIIQMFYGLYWRKICGQISKRSVEFDHDEIGDFDNYEDYERNCAYIFGKYFADLNVMDGCLELLDLRNGLLKMEFGVHRSFRSYMQPTLFHVDIFVSENFK